MNQGQGLCDRGDCNGDTRDGEHAKGREAKEMQSIDGDREAKKATCKESWKLKRSKSEN